jgi:hypothetical protein
MVGLPTFREDPFLTTKEVSKSHPGGFPENQPHPEPLFDAGGSGDFPRYRIRLCLFLKGGAPDLYANGVCQ